MAMASKTPIRLVALDEEPPEEDVTLVQDFLPEEENTIPTLVGDETPAQEAAPLKSTPEHEAITRRVPVAAPAVEPAPQWPKSTRTFRGFVPIVIALVPLGALSAAWFLSRPARPPGNLSPASAVNRDQAPPLPVLVPTAAPSVTAAPEVIRLQISAEPVEAELGLDGNVLAGHRLNLEVPKDRGIHVVSASAPGYFPFNQQVSFSDDIVLRINLRRAHGSAGRPGSHQRPTRVEAKPQTGSRPEPSPPHVESKPQSKSPSRLEPGMDLDAPVRRHGGKSIDERNPYKP
jgi:hypothetical protein